MPTFKYRLQPLLDQKIDLKKQAEEALGQRQKELRDEQQKLEEFHRQHRELTIKRERLRREVLASPEAEPLTGSEVRRRTEYLKRLQLDVDAAKDAIFSQKLLIEECEERLSEARRQLAQCSREVEILKKHREKLEQRFHREVERKEAVEQDEIGNMLYMRRRREP